MNYDIPMHRVQLAIRCSHACGVLAADDLGEAIFSGYYPRAARIAALAFTGEDTANGKSWEAWVSKKESERRAEAARVEADARTRGHL